MALTILEGSTFCICDDRGDVGEKTSGFFASDTRFLSLLKLTVNGHRPLLLSSDRVEYFSAAFFLRNAPGNGLAQDTLSIMRKRFVGEAMQDQMTVQNQSGRPVSFQLELEFGSDFADIFAVKSHDFALGDPASPTELPPLVDARYDRDDNQFVLLDEVSLARTQVILSRPGEVTRGSVTYEIDLEPRERWDLCVDVVPSLNGDVVTRDVAERRFGEELVHVRESLKAWHMRVPQLRADWDTLGHAIDRSVADLASLRIRESHGQLPAAGMPWFMTVFGRDTLITGVQTLLLGPELARNALEVLAVLQAREDDPSIDAEAGKIVHEVRHGKAAKSWFARYYGTLDATPLYLVLLSEVWRWTGDDAFVTGLKEPALRALEWIDRSGDRDGDGFLEYDRRAPNGLENQSWKDSGDSQRFSDGRQAVGPIAPCEVQGYAYDAKRRLAEIARAVWGDEALAERLDREAAALQRRFDDAFWVEERGGYYALALDGKKRRVDSLCSNIGQLLWSGIVPDERVDAVVAALMGDSLWSGWGVRTMSDADAAYNPLSYHNGTVWPHDNSLIALGLARYERWAEALQIVRQLFDATAHLGHALPEVFAGLPRSEGPFPIAYPTAARPQAWAAGTPILLLQVLLGLSPDREEEVLTSVAPALPEWAGGLSLAGVHAFGRLWDVELAGGRVEVTPR